LGVEREDGGVSFRVEGMETAASLRSQLTHLCNVAWLEYGHERQGLIHRLLREQTYHRHTRARRTLLGRRGAGKDGRTCLTTTQQQNTLTNPRPQGTLQANVLILRSATSKRTSISCVQCGTSGVDCETINQSINRSHRRVVQDAEVTGMGHCPEPLGLLLRAVQPCHTHHVIQHAVTGHGDACGRRSAGPGTSTSTSTDAGRGIGRWVPAWGGR
jgi:hypothetical protein